MAEAQDQKKEQGLLEQLYAAVGEAEVGELVSEELLRERREEAAREARDYE